MQKLEKIISKKEHLSLFTIAMPKDANAHGIIFGGWTLAQMDIAGAICARKMAWEKQAKIYTRAVNDVEFLNMIEVGDVVSVYSEIIKQGNTSIQVKQTVITEKYSTGDKAIVATGVYVYVCKKRSINE